MTQVRDHECMNCKLRWTSPVRMSEWTPNLSGEAREYCPRCHTGSVMSMPAYNVEETPR